MNREILLARRLIEASADPYSSTVESEQAAGELAAATSTEGNTADFLLRVDDFERLTLESLSPVAWLLLIENAGPEAIELPDTIVESLFQDIAEPAFRLRLVSAVIGQLQTRRKIERSFDINRDEPQLPACWLQRHLRQLAARGSADDGNVESAAEELREFVLYLLQEGSLAARVVAAVATAPKDAWRESARSLVRNIVEATDPEMRDFGRPFAFALRR